MNLNDYVKWTDETAMYPECGTGSVMARAYVGHKLSGELGEVQEHLGKAIRDDGGAITPERLMEITKEIGDYLWYTARLISELGLDAEEILDINVAKLTSRKERGVIGGSGDNR